MGLQFLGYSFSPFLCIGMFATFRKSGNIPLLKGTLIIYHVMVLRGVQC